MAAAGLANTISSRLFIQDKGNRTWYLVDTGSDVSLVTANASELKREPIRHLFAANGTPIRVFGEKVINVKIGLKRELIWVFVITDCENSIIGADFLEHFKILVDLDDQCLIDKTTGMTTKGKKMLVPVPEIKSIAEDSEWFHLVKKYPGITNPTAKRKPNWDHNTKHNIETTGRPVFAKPRRLPPDKLKAAKLIFQKMQEEGECRPGKGAWSSPIPVSYTHLTLPTIYSV